MALPGAIPYLFIFFDIVTGLLKATMKKELDSQMMRVGLFNKIAEVGTLVFGALLDYATDYVSFGVDVPAYAVVSIYICIMETISTLENLAVMNPHLYQLFEPYLAKLNGKAGNIEEGGEM